MKHPLRRVSLLLSIPGIILPIVLSGCGGKENGREKGDIDTSRASEFGFQKSVQTSLVDEGGAAYRIYCIGCHGSSGDGNGEAARFLDPRPRNFQLANFKFSSTRSGQLPRDEDLRRAITYGLRGSAMPGWDLLPERTVSALIAYIKTFSPKWKQRPSFSSIPEVNDPYRSLADKSKAIERGRAVYHGFATCWTCHPSYVSNDEINRYLVLMENPPRDVFRDDLGESQGKVNSEGELVYPPDFLRDFVRGGSRVEDLYRSVAAGITGTAMPTWVDSMDYSSSKPGHPALVQRSDMWAIAYYVQSLIEQRPPKLKPEEVIVRHRPQRIYKPDEAFEPVREDQGTEEGGEFSEDEEEFQEDE